jgi:HSP20 family protein
MRTDRVGKGSPDMSSLPERMGQAWRSLIGMPFLAFSGEGVWHPTVDVYDRQDDIVVEVELPGMKGQKVDVSLEEDHLVIEGARKPARTYKEGELYYVERPTGEFHRIVHLPCSVDAAATVADYEDGVLTITMPKTARAKARKIEIR